MEMELAHFVARWLGSCEFIILVRPKQKTQPLWISQWIWYVDIFFEVIKLIPQQYIQLVAPIPLVPQRHCTSNNRNNYKSREENRIQKLVLTTLKTRLHITYKELVRIDIIQVILPIKRNIVFLPPHRASILG